MDGEGLAPEVTPWETAAGHLTSFSQVSFTRDFSDPADFSLDRVQVE